MQPNGSIAVHALRRHARVLAADCAGADEHISSVLADMLEHIAEEHPESD